MSAWMPRSVSWLRVSILIGIASLMSGGLIFSGRYGKFLLFGNTNPSLFLLTLAIALVLPFIAYAYIHCWLLGNKPKGWAKKIPSPSSIKEAALSYVVMFFGILIALVITSPFVPNSSRYTGRYLQDLEMFSAGVAFTWAVVSIYIFHGYDLINNPPSKKSVDKAKTEPANNKVNSVDRDLVNLKNRTGIHFKEPPKK
jgi:hypothetical protein